MHLKHSGNVRYATESSRGVACVQAFDLGEAEVTHCRHQHEATNQFWIVFMTKLKAVPIRRLGKTAVRIAQVAPLAESRNLYCPRFLKAGASLSLTDESVRDDPDPKAGRDP